jgi:hypothetical protein
MNPYRLCLSRLPGSAYYRNPSGAFNPETGSLGESTNNPQLQRDRRPRRYRKIVVRTYLQQKVVQVRAVRRWTICRGR